MTPGSHGRPTERATERPAGRLAGRLLSRLRSDDRRAALPWRIGTPLVVLLSGTLFVASAESSEGTDLRPGRYTDLASLVEAESEQYDALRGRVARLDREVDELSEAVADQSVDRQRSRVEALRDPAGLEPRTGPGLRITLSDAPAEVVENQPPDADLNPYVVHQQDIQAVVNALWKGGATAVTIAGQRIITTTGIKCEGNAVTLHGVPYPQPYVIEAVGDPLALRAAIDADDYVAGYRYDASQPDISVGWDLEVDDHLVAPAYDGVLRIDYAEPLA